MQLRKCDVFVDQEDHEAELSDVDDSLSAFADDIQGQDSDGAEEDAEQQASI